MCLNAGGGQAREVAPTLYARPPGTDADTVDSLILVAFSAKDYGADAAENVSPTLRQGYPAARVGMAVRRLTPRECERLQGFPDDYTLIPNYRRKLRAGEAEEIAAYLGIPVEEARELGATPDGPRYKAIGNSMAVPVMRWIGERIQAVEDLHHGY